MFSTDFILFNQKCQAAMQQNTIEDEELDIKICKINI